MNAGRADMIVALGADLCAERFGRVAARLAGRRPHLGFAVAAPGVARVVAGDPQAVHACRAWYRALGGGRVVVRASPLGEEGPADAAGIEVGALGEGALIEAIVAVADAAPAGVVVQQG